MKNTLFSKRRILIFFIVILAGIASALAVNKLNAAANADANPAHRLIGKEFFNNAPLPEAELFDYQTNAARGAELKQGKVLMIYLETGCFGCQKESDILNEMYISKDPDVKIYGVADEAGEALRNFVKTQNFKYPILIDKTHKLRDSLNINYFPANFVLTDGTIKKSWFGNPKDEEDLYKKLNLEETK